MLINAYGFEKMCRAGIPVLDVFPMTSSYAQNMADQVHPSQNVYRQWLEILSNYFKNTKPWWNYLQIVVRIQLMRLSLHEMYWYGVVWSHYVEYLKNIKILTWRVSHTLKTSVSLYWMEWYNVGIVLISFYPFHYQYHIIRGGYSSILDDGVCGLYGWVCWRKVL